MVIQNLDGQLIANDNVFGVELLAALEEHRVERIEAGTIMVAKFNDRGVQYLFEVSSDLDVSKLKGASLMYPLQGSRVPLRSLPDGVTKSMINGKTVLMRDCRLPTALEYDVYLNSSAV